MHHDISNQQTSINTQEVHFLCYAIFPFIIELLSILLISIDLWGQIPTSYRFVRITCRISTKNNEVHPFEISNT